jgi:hypothetical protein
MPEAPLPKQLQSRDRERITRYQTLLAFYNGDQWPAKRTDRRRQLTLNYARTFAHTATAALMKGRTVTVEPTDDSDAATDRAAETEVAINQVWRHNGLEALDFDTELDCAVLGDAAYKVWWDPDAQQVRVTAPDPSGIFAWWLPTDPSRFWRIANRYALDGDDAAALFPGLTLLRRNTIIEAWTLDMYELWLNDTLVDARPNPYPFIPFVIFPNVRDPQQVWGTSDLQPLLDILRELNREVTQLSYIMELSGNPIAVLEGVDEAQDIAVKPGTVWELPKDAKAYLLDLLRGGGVKLHTDFLQALYRGLHDLAETPRSAFGDINRDLSGVALELELDPLVRKIDRKRLIRTTAYTQRNDMILALLDTFAGTSFGPTNNTIAWGSVLPTDRDRQVQHETLLTQAGIHSRRFAADELGDVDDPDAEFARWLEEQRQLTPPTTPP